MPLATKKRYVIASSTLVLILLLFGEGPRSVFAQQRQSDVGPRPILQAHHVQSSISVDGRLDEAAWQQAEAISGFMQSEPDEGAGLR